MNLEQKVENPKVEVAETPEMNDKDYLTDLLESLKNMVNNYSYALNETSNRSLYDEIKKIFDETSNLQRLFFDYLFQRGWYCLEREKEQKITEAKQKMSSKISEMNY
jgi:spore coat protein CotF